MIRTLPTTTTQGLYGCPYNPVRMVVHRTRLLDRRMLICSECGRKQINNAQINCIHCSSYKLSDVDWKNKINWKFWTLSSALAMLPIYGGVVCSILALILWPIKSEMAIVPLAFAYIIYTLYCLPIHFLMLKIGGPAIIYNHSGAMVLGINGWQAVGIVFLCYWVSGIVICLLFGIKPNKNKVQKQTE